MKIETMLCCSLLGKSYPQNIAFERDAKMWFSLNRFFLDVTRRLNVWVGHGKCLYDVTTTLVSIYVYLRHCNIKFDK